MTTRTVAVILNLGITETACQTLRVPCRSNVSQQNGDCESDVYGRELRTSTRSELISRRLIKARHRDCELLF